MEKTYLAPDMEIVNIQIGQLLLDGSIGKGDGTESANNSDASRYYEDDEEDEEDW